MSSFSLTCCHQQETFRKTNFGKKSKLTPKVSQIHGKGMRSCNELPIKDYFWTNFFTRIVPIRQIAHLDQGLVNLKDQWSRLKRRNESAAIICFILVLYCCYYSGSMKSAFILF